MNRYWTLLQQTEEETDLYIYGDIRHSEYNESDVSSYSLARQLQDVRASRINVHINSFGGEVGEGFAIYNALCNHPAQVTTWCDGFACSAASVIFMAGDERVMSDTSMLMIHNASMATVGTPSQLRKDAEDLQKITDASMTAYMRCVNITADALRDMMENETWITVDEALEMGFATRKSVTDTADQPTQSVRRQIFTALISRQEPYPTADAIADAVAERLQRTTVAQSPVTVNTPEPVSPIDRLMLAFKK